MTGEFKRRREILCQETFDIDDMEGDHIDPWGDDRMMGCSDSHRNRERANIYRFMPRAWRAYRQRAYPMI